MSNAIKMTEVKAVQEPGYVNGWSLQTQSGETVARVTVCSDAEGWAKRIVEALNAQLRNSKMVA